MPAAPPRLSMITGWPSTSCIFGCRLRATKSRLPPGGKGTTNLIGRLGYGCASTRELNSNTARIKVLYIARPLYGGMLFQELFVHLEPEARLVQRPDIAVLVDRTGV